MRKSIWWVAAIAIAAVAAALLARFIARRAAGLPQPGSPQYEATTTDFYRGLAELQVGLLDDAKRSFNRAAESARREPATWANLGLAHLRLGEFDAAAEPIGRAVQLAPTSSDLVLLQGRLETSRGKLDEGIARYRRAIELDPGNMRARYALAEEIERAGGPDADKQAEEQFDAILKARPGNLAVLLERARLSAKRGDAASLDEAIRTLNQYVAGWPEPAVEQYRALQTAANSRNFQDAARDVAFLRNVLVRTTVFRESLAAVRTPTELIAEPLERFLALPSPSSKPSAPDEGLTFAALGVEPGQRLAGRVAIDWNRDFKMDFATCDTTGVHLFVDGASKDLLTADCVGLWAADIEMDGDVDLIAGVRGAAPVVLRNNGDGTSTQLKPFPGVVGLHSFAWGDIDGDGDPDAVLVGENGDLHVFENRQAGEFREFTTVPPLGTVVAVAVGDLNADGVLDIVTLDRSRAIKRTSVRDSQWKTEYVEEWPAVIGPQSIGEYRIFVEDLDNNGALDLIVSGTDKSDVWLFDEMYKPRHLRGFPSGFPVFRVADVNGDGQLDLIGERARSFGKGTMGYHWQAMRPRAQPTAGDQRINSFGIGGEIEIRSGLLTQKQMIAGDTVHFGLGTRTSIDVARIFWPNGIMQADFDRKADQTVVAEQRLKGSCPWVFTYDGSGMRFVTDFLWRSPLGLRINAQDTAGVTQTEDWIKIRGDQLVARDGAYDVRITAELWETHFIDYVSLLVVDHPADEEVFVDERFAREAPALAVHTVKNVRPVAHAWDQAGRDVTDVVSVRDGRYLSTFTRGPYQGIAQDHFVEIDLGEEIRGPERPALQAVGRSFQGRQWLIANGWIYPTDSSINVAIAQAGIQPHGLSLEAQDASGRWTVVAPDLGFPAGKNKTILIDLGQVALAGISHVRRVRLRTNLEIYWDSLSVADAAADDTVQTTRVPAAVAELRYRGFSKTDFSRRDVPETPHYGELANVGQRWRDLVGYYTRYGNVSELLTSVDDRYVIMNAGDELRLSFPEPHQPSPAASAGFARDYVLVGDGWEKDGDYNTTYSKTVEPLPRHGHPNYEAERPVENIEDDPVYRAHPADWQRYHTRFVAPDVFLNGLR